MLGSGADFVKVLFALKEEKIVKKDLPWKDIIFYDSHGSVGVKGNGLIGLHEVLENFLAIKEMILKKESAIDIEAQAREEGMLTVAEDGLFKAAEGKISIDEILL